MSEARCSAGSTVAGRVGVIVNSRSVAVPSRAETKDDVRPIVSTSFVALSLRLPDVNRSGPLSAIFADDPIVLYGREAEALRGPVEIELAFRTRLPAAESSITAGEGAVAAAALGSAAAMPHAQKAARTERRKVMTQTRPLWPGMRTLTQLLRVA